MIRAGARIPADGVVERGTSEIDRSLLTGESLPVFAGQGAVLSAGELNLTGPLTLRVTAAGRDSSLHRMADLVAAAESARNKYTSLAERAARFYSPAVHILSFGAFLVWMWKTGGDLRFAVNISAAVLIITCPCALGLAVPAVVTAASGKLFRKGLLIKNGFDVLFSGLWWVSIFPGLFIMLLVFGINLLGDFLRDELNPRLK